MRGYKETVESKVVGSVAFQVNADGAMTVEKRPGKDAANFTADALTEVR